MPESRGLPRIGGDSPETPQLSRIALTEGEGRATVFRVNDDTLGMSPSLLNMPPLPSEKVSLLGIVLGIADKTIKALAVENRVGDQTSSMHNICLYSLEVGEKGRASWVDAKASELEIRRYEAKKGAYDLVISDGDNSEGENVIVRTKPTFFEKRTALVYSPQDQKNARKNHRRRYVASKITATIMTVLNIGAISGSFVELGEDPNKIVIKSTDDLVGSSKVPVIDGKPQAEVYYDDATLDRSREAVAAWRAGDTDKLQHLVNEYGYNANWIGQELIDQVKNAESFAQLDSVFGCISPSGAITMESYTDGSMASLDTEYYSRQKLDNDDLEEAKDSALAVIEVLNSFDKRLFENANISFVLSKSIRLMSVYEVSGYTAYRGNSTLIELDITAPRVNITAGHELSHWRDNDETKSAEIAKLNPLGLSEGVYVGNRVFKDNTLSTKIDQYRIVTRPYGRMNAGEDLATVSEGWFDNPGVIELDRTPLGEKRMDYLFNLERDYPGATAALLLSKRPHIHETVSAADDISYGVSEMSRIPFAPGLFGSGLVASMLFMIFESAYGADLDRRIGREIKKNPKKTIETHRKP